MQQKRFGTDWAFNRATKPLWNIPWQVFRWAAWCPRRPTVFALNFHVPVRWQEKLCWPLTSAFVKSPAVKYGDRLASSWSAFVCLIESLQFPFLAWIHLKRTLRQFHLHNFVIKDAIRDMSWGAFASTILWSRPAWKARSWEMDNHIYVFGCSEPSNNQRWR